MESKNIDFEKLSDVCKYRSKRNECSEDDNISGECNENECPIWGDLEIHDEEE